MLRIYPPMPGTWVRTLIWEDFTCCEATKPRTAATEPVLQSPGAATAEPRCPEPVLDNKRSHCNEHPTHCNERVGPLPQLEKAYMQQ